MMIYHYKDKEGNYCTFELDGKEYTNYENLMQKVHGDKDGFVPTDKTPFDAPESIPEQLALDDTMPFD